MLNTMSIAPREFHLVSASLSNIRMKTIDEIRRNRLKELITLSGSVRLLADVLERSPAQVSQWSNASIDPKSGRPRAISTVSARYIEKKLGRPEGWMDRAEESSSDDNPESEVSDGPAADVIRAVLRLEAKQEFPRELADRILGVLAGTSQSGQVDRTQASVDLDQLQLILDGQESIRAEVGELIREIRSAKKPAAKGEGGQGAEQK